MFALPHQLYTDRYDPAGAGQRAADLRAGEIAAALRDVRLRVWQALRPRRAAAGSAPTAAAPLRLAGAGR